MRPTSLLRCLIVACPLLFALPAAADEVEVTEEARQHFKTGVAFLQDPDGARYEEAYQEFKAAYAASPSWKILGNLGIAAMKLERDGEAIWAFEKYLEEGGDQIVPAERKQFERDLARTRAGVVYVTLESQPPGAEFVDERIPLSGRPVVNRYEVEDGPLRLGIRRGDHRITARLDGYEPQVWEFEARPGEELQHTFELEKPQAEATPASAAAPQAQPQPGPRDTGPTPVATERPVPVSVWATLGATGALAVGGGVVGILASGKQSDFEDVNDGTSPGQAQDLKDQGQRLNLIADVMFGGAVVAGAVTAYLFFTRPEVPVEQDTAIRISPSVGREGGGLSVSGRF